MEISIDDMIDYIETSALEDTKKLWLLKNISALRTKYKDKFGEDIKLD